MSATTFPAGRAPRRARSRRRHRPIALARGDHRLPGDPDLDADAALQHGRGRAGAEGRRVQRQSLAGQPDAGRLLDRADARATGTSRISGTRWATACTSAVATSALTLAIGTLDQLRHRPHAPAQRLAGQQRRPADLRDPDVVPGDPVLPGDAELWPVRPSLGGDLRRGHLRHALCDLHLPAIRHQHPDRTRRGGTHRRRVALADLSGGSICR